MDYLSIMEVGQIALDYHQQRVEMMAKNIAMSKVSSADGAIYSQMDVVMESEAISYTDVINHSEKNAVDIKTVTRESEPNIVYDPGHPHANSEGYVQYSGVDLAWATTTMLESSRMYEANVQMMNVNKQMLMTALTLGD